MRVTDIPRLLRYGVRLLRNLPTLWRWTGRIEACPHCTNLKKSLCDDHAQEFCHIVADEPTFPASAVYESLLTHPEFVLVRTDGEAER